MNLEQITEAANQMAEVWHKLGIELSEMGERMLKLIREAFVPCRCDTPPKKYGMSLRKCPRRTSVHYNYIPRAPRNLPYMRRAY